MAAAGLTAAATAAYAAATISQAIQGWVAHSSGGDDQLDIDTVQGLLAVRTGLRNLNDMLNSEGGSGLREVLSNIAIGAPGAPPLRSGVTEAQATTALNIASKGLDNAAGVMNDIISIDALESGAATELTEQDVVGMVDRYLLAVEVRPPSLFLQDELWILPYPTNLPPNIPLSLLEGTRQNVTTEMSQAPAEYGPNLFTAVAIIRALFGESVDDDALGLSLWEQASNIYTGDWFAGGGTYRNARWFSGPSGFPVGAVTNLQVAYHAHSLHETSLFVGTVAINATDPAVVANGLNDDAACVQFNRATAIYSSFAPSVAQSPGPWSAIQAKYD